MFRFGKTVPSTKMKLKKNWELFGVIIKEARCESKSTISRFRLTELVRLAPVPQCKKLGVPFRRNLTYLQDSRLETHTKCSNIEIVFIFRKCSNWSSSSS